MLHNFLTSQLRHTPRLPAVLESSIGMSATDLKAVSILVVEDESLLRRQLAANLERFGADVTMADSMAAARQRLRDGQFDFVLLDVNLPDGLGTDLLREKVFPRDGGHRHDRERRRGQRGRGHAAGRGGLSGQAV
jgi:hypothetical protein